jgi:hypothetical protein
MSFSRVELQEQLAEVAAGTRSRVDSHVADTVRLDDRRAEQQAGEALAAARAQATHAHVAAGAAKDAARAQERAARASEEQVQLQQAATRAQERAARAAEEQVQLQQEALEQQQRAAEDELEFKREAAAEALALQERTAADQLSHERRVRYEENLKTSPCLAAAEALHELRHYEALQAHVDAARQVTQLGREAELVVVEQRQDELQALRTSTEAQLSEAVALAAAAKAQDEAAEARLETRKAPIRQRLAAAQAHADTLKGSWLPFSKAEKERKAALDAVAHINQELAAQPVAPPGEYPALAEKVAQLRRTLEDAQKRTARQDEHFASEDCCTATRRALEKAGFRKKLEQVQKQLTAARARVAELGKPVDVNLCLRLDHLRAAQASVVEYPGLGPLPFAGALAHAMSRAAELRHVLEATALEEIQKGDAATVNLRGVLNHNHQFVRRLHERPAARALLLEECEADEPIGAVDFDFSLPSGPRREDFASEEAYDFFRAFGCTEEEFDARDSPDEFDFGGPSDASSTEPGFFSTR